MFHSPHTDARRSLYRIDLLLPAPSFGGIAVELPLALEIHSDELIRLLFLRMVPIAQIALLVGVRLLAYDALAVADGGHTLLRGHSGPDARELTYVRWCIIRLVLT
jgi:hypothetical protein